MDTKKILKTVLIFAVDAAILTAVSYAAYKAGYYAQTMIAKKKKEKEGKYTITDSTGCPSGIQT